MKFFKKNMSKEMKTVNIKPQIESEKYVISEKNIENKENEPIRLDGMYFFILFSALISMNKSFERFCKLAEMN